jgi:predicted 2-oxoglutarate/Fe(II)-dependent dioxygenase YbiX
MNIVDDFNEKCYVVVKEMLSPEMCQTSIEHLFKLYERGQTKHDPQCPLSDSVYGDPLFDNILNELAPHFSEMSGKELLPAYSYARIYRPGETLKFHKDRPACEVSATITLGVKGEPWPIFFNKKDTAEYGTKVLLQPGDGVLYKGCDIYHWREEFKGEWQCQIFFHYVDANGPYKHQKFDGRSTLGVEKEYCLNNKEQPYYYWQFENVLSPDYCDFIINKYASNATEKGRIGGDSINDYNPKIRNVEKTQLPLHEGIGAQLIGNAFIANQQAWNFDINMCNQIEYLKYSVEGRYKPHLDIFFNNEQQYQRKLTTLAFLNDDFDGGRLFLQVSQEKLYPLQTKGTVIVFPSYYLHGVEDIIRGTRHSIVCWMLGPKLK